MAGRLYHDLSWLWPLWEDVSAYAEETEAVIADIRAHSAIPVASLLDMSCGGGKNDAWLKRHFDVWGIDISEPMLAQARRLNPECTYRVADMRDARLGRSFDAVFINDGLIHIASEPELAAVFATAHRHLNPGGVMVCLAEVTRESFQQNRAQVSVAAAACKPAHIDVTFVESHYDPDPADDSFEWTAVYLIREHGRLRVEHDVDIVGLFSLDTWRRTLRGAGFEVVESTHRLAGQDYPAFVARKPP